MYWLLAGSQAKSTATATATPELEELPHLFRLRVIGAKKLRVFFYAKVKVLTRTSFDDDEARPITDSCLRIDLFRRKTGGRCPSYLRLSLVILSLSVPFSSPRESSGSRQKMSTSCSHKTIPTTAIRHSDYYSKTKKIYRSNMGTGVSKYPNAKCTVCAARCCDELGHRIRHPHKSRCCCVCKKWHCGTHKTSHMRQRLKYEGHGGSAYSYYVYKCKSCVGTPRPYKHLRS